LNKQLDENDVMSQRLHTGNPLNSSLLIQFVLFRTCPIFIEFNTVIYQSHGW